MPIIPIDRWVLSITGGNRNANKYIFKSIFDFLNSNGLSVSQTVVRVKPRRVGSRRQSAVH